MSDIYPSADLPIGPRAAMSHAMDSLEDDPEKAGQASRLADATGDHPALVYGDLENYQVQHKAMLTSALISSNQHLQDYIDSHPLAAKVSNDDYPTLDTVSTHLQQLGLMVDGNGKPTAGSVLAAAAKGFQENFDAESLAADHQKLAEWMQTQPVFGNIFIQQATSLGGLALEGSMRLIGGAIGGLSSGVGQAYKSLGGNEAEADRLTRDLIILANVAMSGQAGLHGIVHPEVHAQISEIHNAVRPYIAEGKEPPVGVHPVIDKMKIEQNKLDLDKLDEAFKESQGSTTRERNPDMYADFVRQHTNSEIGISAEAIKELYGDKPPASDDNILGFIPDLANQLETALATGGDIQIPLADWLAKVDPKVAKDLHDDIRVRPGGVTKNEGQRLSEIEKVLAKPEEVVLEQAQVPGPVESLRSASSLKPLFDQPRERKLQLERATRDEFKKVFTGDAGYAFTISDAGGRKVADLDIAEEKGGKHLYVDDIRGTGGFGPNDLGPSAMRDLIRQLKAEFPNAETLGGFRVSGAREKAGTWETKGAVTIKLDDPNLIDLRTLMEDKGTWEQYTDDTNAFVKEREAYTKNEQAIVKAVNDELNKLVPKGVDIHEAHAIRGETMEDVKHGSYIQYEGRKPIILWALEAPDPIGTGRHEAIHHLHQYGFFKNDEWATLMHAAVERGWLKEFDIDNRYPDLKPADKIEEAVAEAFANWRRTESETITPIGRMFKRLQNFLDRVKAAIGKVLGKEPQWNDLFEAVERGDIGSREGNNPREPNAYREQSQASKSKLQRMKVEDLVSLANELNLTEKAIYEFRGGPVRKEKLIANIFEEQERLRANSIGEQSQRPTQPELPGITRMEDRKLFDTAAAAGMTVDQYGRYMKLIAKRRQEDLDAIVSKVAEGERKRQTAEWKANTKTVRQEVDNDIRNRPDIAADSLLRDGVLFGDRVEPRPKLAADSLTEEQKAALPKEFVAKDGMNPDDLASLFGYNDGASMVERLSELEKARAASGMKPDAYTDRLIDVETERRMQQKYGSLDQHTLEEVKDHILSDTQMDLLHEEVLALGMKAGTELSITKEQMKSWAEEKFAGLKVEDVSSDKFLAAAGKAGKLAEEGLLKEKPGDAFKAKQQQHIALLMAKEARGLEKAEAQFEKTVKRFTKREVKGVEQSFTNYIHQMLAQAEVMNRRGDRDIADSIAKDGNTTLDKFAQEKVADGWELGISEDILAGDIKPLAQMTVAEFRDFKDAIDSMAHVGKAVKQIEVAGQKLDFEEYKAEVLANIRELPTRAKEKQKSFLYRWDASLTRMEEIVKDLDLRKELGPLFNGMIRPMMDAKHKEYLLQEALAKELASIRSHGKDWQKTLSDTIPNDFFLDPDTGMAFDLTREHLINIMLNFGNKSNVDKFTRGWVGKEKAGEFEAKLRQLIGEHATKEDWDFAQRMGDIFEGWRKDTDTLYHNLSGIAPKWIQIDPITTSHGDYRGWYFPIIYDKYFSGIDVVKDKASGDMFGPNYFRATTGNNHTKARTGYIDRVEFQNSIEQVATRMQQMMHDISYRSAVMDVRKIVYDKGIREAIRKHYGGEYEAQLDPWLKDIANHFNQNEVANSAMNNMLRRARMNLSAHALGLNLKVIGSPDVGTLNPAAIARVMNNYDANVALAWEKSKEIPHSYRNMDRDFRERLENIIVKSGWDSFQATAVRGAFVPLVKVSQGFRIVTFVDEYKKGLDRGLSENDAAALADSQVRLRHGATGVPDLPAIMRGSEGMKMATMFYGFFNAMQNWQRQIPGNIRRGEFGASMEAMYGAVIIPSVFGALLFNKADKDESWWKTMGKAISLELMGTVPLVRDLGSTMIEGFKPSTPIGSLFQAMASAYSDGKHYAQRKKVEKPITHAANLVGLGLGLPLAQIGRTAQFADDVRTGRQKPKNILEWVRGVIHGDMKQKK